MIWKSYCVVTNAVDGSSNSSMCSMICMYSKQRRSEEENALYGTSISSLDFAAFACTYLNLECQTPLFDMRLLLTLIFICFTNSSQRPFTNHHTPTQQILPQRHYLPQTYIYITSTSLLLSHLSWPSSSPFFFN